MSEHKHTRGPWRVAGGTKSVWTVTAHGEGNISKTVNGGYLIADTFGTDRRANADLIAAAPELLAVARLVLDVDNAKSAKEHLEKMARAAIAKATGGAQ